MIRFDGELTTKRRQKPNKNVNVWLT